MCLIYNAMKVERAFLIIVLVGFAESLSVGYEGGSPGPPTDFQESNLCDFSGSYQRESDLVNIQLTHTLFETDVLIPGVLYQVHITSHGTASITDLVLKASVYSTFSSQSNSCGANTYSTSLPASFYWSFPGNVNVSNITLRTKVGWICDRSFETIGSSGVKLCRLKDAKLHNENSILFS